MLPDSPMAAASLVTSASANGTGDVSTLEVGNEPWIAGMGFSDPAFYSAVLLGMARGAKAADPAMRVLPAAFGSLADLLARVNATHVSSAGRPQRARIQLDSDYARTYWCLSRAQHVIAAVAQQHFAFS